MDLCIFTTGIFLFSLTMLSGQPQERSMDISQRYLNIPVSQYESREVMTLILEDGIQRQFNIRLSDGKPDYWVFVDLKSFKDQNLTIRYPIDRKGMDQIYLASQITGQDSFYREVNRPQFHFSSKRGWNNDPNGLVYLNGIYHLFYQHNPYEIFWENMHWGHATSPDLIHWEEQGDVLFPDTLGMMFSGSAIVDHRNTAGFQKGNEKVLVAFYTAHLPGRETQCLAYSNDNGRTWTKYQGNPLIDSHEKWDSGNTRDPRVFWHEESGRWVMVLFEKDGHSIYTSDNLKEWTFRSHQTGFWECPELIRLPVDGDSNHTKWVMYGASGTYFIGDFDGEKFTIESGKHRYYAGAMYAAQTYNNLPGSSGQVVQIGWGQISHPGMPFNQMMTIPTELSLRSTRNGIRLFSRPISNIKALYMDTQEWTDITIDQANEELQKLRGDLWHIRLEVEMVEGVAFDLHLHGKSIATYDFNHNKLNGVFYEGDKIERQRINLEILVDRTSVEVFADDGKMTVVSARPEALNEEGLKFVPRDEVIIRHLEVNRLRSIWN